MKNILTTTALIGLCGFATPAIAETSIGGELGLTYIHAPDDGFDYQSQIVGSIEVGYGSFGAQVDVNAFQYEGDPSLRAATLHVFYEVLSGWDVGVAYTAEEDDRYAYLETMYVSGANAVEAFYGSYIGEDYGVYGIEYSRDFGAVGSLGDVGAYVGYAAEAGDFGTTNPYVGATVGLGNGFELDARYASMDDGDYRYISFGITREFGAGTTFSDRGFAGAFPGY